MRIVKFPEQKNWAPLLARPMLDNRLLRNNVEQILEAVKEEGDLAVKRFTLQFDGVETNDFEVSSQEIEGAGLQLSESLSKAIEQAASNIKRFHQQQLQSPEIIETMPGIRCWRSSIGIEKVGLYIPGGTAPLFSTLLMLGIPAVIAGCKEIILCSPPDQKGSLHPAILFAAQLIGIKRIFKIGGVQAIAAMAYGTETVPAVYKIFGPGNQYVTCAKQLIQQSGIAIDMPAGPSEVAVFADHTANAAYVAADLLSQAEHGADSQVLLVTTHEPLINLVQVEIDLQVNQLPRKNTALQALNNSTAILVESDNTAMQLLNEYAAEHLILSCENALELASQVINAGSVFIGHYSPESVGDYASGTNHTLPTNGYARAYSGVSVDSFVKKITFQQLSRTGLNNIGNTVMEMAAAEGLEAHLRAVKIRLLNTVQKS